MIPLNVLIIHFKMRIGHRTDTHSSSLLTMISMAVHRDVPQYIAMPWLIT